MILDLHATPGEVMRAVHALQEFGRANKVPENALFGLALALEECGSNIVNHALERDRRQKFQVLFQCSNEAFLIELRDRGPAFDPTKAAQIKAQPEDHDPPGGWGIQLARRFTDEIRYTREGGENVLRLTKRLTATLTKPM